MLGLVTSDLYFNSPILVTVKLNNIERVDDDIDYSTNLFKILNEITA